MTLAFAESIDAARCSALFFKAVREGAAPHYDAAQRHAWAPSEETPDWMTDRLRNGVTWIATDGTNDRGFLTASAPTQNQAHLDLFFVAPIERRGDTAPTLYDAFVAWAIEQRKSQLTTHASHMLRPFLLRRGWQVDSEDITHRHGVAIPRSAMSLSL